MDNTQVAKKILTDVQAVITEALDNLDRLPETVPVDTAVSAVHTCAAGYGQHIDNLDVETCAYILLKKYQGHAPANGDVLTFKTAIELMLHNEYGVPASKF